MSRTNPDTGMLLSKCTFFSQVLLEQEKGLDLMEGLRINILSAQVEAALQGHEIGPFEPIEDPGLTTYQAVCRKCGRPVYASSVNVFSILAETCPATEQHLADSESSRT